ncbi:aspartate kinase [Geosporobacter subterraneus DSM 17957]|uniref:Aspartokinase n=1 Tax=Geosporobacter subterraneus DSM 17957 TaxID=1121919 RepID=A0A1M6H8R5_9FIRM|nr:aspartate kinase [Geosporobacter subterraneus]SHJ18582.1 aspartate kinase [Geosporobacter subterraneus DSM 17957]
MGLVVQKFGGTSVATPEGWRAMLRHVSTCRANGNEVIVVVSAMGRKGAPYATDTLIQLLEEVDPAIEGLKKDFIMSCGEMISAAIISHYFEVNGLYAVPMTGFQAGIHTNNTFNNADILHIDTQSIKQCIGEGKIAVVSGFQGITEDGWITTLGRGGSDTTAVALGAYLHADRVDIFTDVPGVAITDPRIVSNVTYLPEISYDDMYKLALNGAKVIHPRAVKAAKKSQIPVQVRSTFSDAPGTLILQDPKYHRQNIIGIAYEKDYSCVRTPIENKSLYTKLKDHTYLYKESNQSIAAYYKSDVLLSKIYPNGLPFENARADIGKIAVFHDQSRCQSIQQQIYSFLAGSMMPILDSFSFSDHFVIMISNEFAIECIQRIYNQIEIINHNLSLMA